MATEECICRTEEFPETEIGKEGRIVIHLTPGCLLHALVLDVLAEPVWAWATWRGPPYAFTSELVEALEMGTEEKGQS